MSSINRRRVLRAGATVGGALLLSGTFAIRARAGETITLYNGQHRETTEALVDAFARETGIEVVIRAGESSQLAGQIAEEGANSPADLFYSEQTPPIAYISEKGLLEPIAAETLKQVPAKYRAKDGTWIGSTVRARVIAYNKKMIQPSELPASILDLNAPEYRDKFGYAIRDGFQEQIIAISIMKGRGAALDWLRGVKRYGQLYTSNRAAVTAVESGEVAMALANNYYWFSFVEEAGGADKANSALHFVGNQDPGALLLNSSAGILKSSRRKEMAQKFIAFMVSEKGQQAQIDTVGEYPVRDGIESPFDLYPLDKFEANAVTSADIGSAADAYVLEREAGII